MAPALQNRCGMGTRALALSLLLLDPALALAALSQGQATLSVNDRTEFDLTQINRADCASTTENVTISYWPLVTGNFQTGSDKYRFFAGTSACSGTVPSSSSGFFASDLGAATTAQQTLTVSGDALRAALGQSCTGANDVTYYVCVYLVDGSGTGIVGTAFSGALTFQTAVPPAPAIGVAPADTALDVTLTQGATTSTETADTSITYQVVASATGYPTVTTPAPPTSSTSIRVPGLTNFVEYTVVGYAFSSAGNESGPSNAAIGTPLPFESFWEAYQKAGGREQGGCGGGAGALSLLALLPLALRRRRP